MGGLNRSLGDGMRHKEEIELSIFDLTLLNEASIDVSALRGVLNELIALGGLSLLEESLSDTLVHNDQSNLGRLDRSGSLLVLLLLGGGFSRTGGILGIGLVFLSLEDAVLLSNDLVKLVELFVNDHLSHGIADTITVDEDVLRHGAIEVAVTLEGALEVVGEDTGRNNLLSFLGLGSGLSVVLAEVRVVGGTESNGTLLSFMAHIDTHEHSSLGDLRAEAHTPQVTTDLGIHLADDVHEDTVIVLGDGSVGNELRDDRGLTVDFILQERIEVLVVGVVRHDHQEDETGFGTRCDMGLDTRVVVELDTLGEGLEELVFVLGCPVLNEADVSILNEDI